LWLAVLANFVLRDEADGMIIIILLLLFKKKILRRATTGSHCSSRYSKDTLYYLITLDNTLIQSDIRMMRLSAMAACLSAPDLKADTE
jgi:hypothetical protein